VSADPQGLTHDEAIPALPLSAMCALIDCSVPADGVVVQEAIARGTDVTADVFAEAGEVIGATYRERWKSTAGVSAEGMIAPSRKTSGTSSGRSAAPFSGTAWGTSR
jgi:hypothetical protein